MSVSNPSPMDFSLVDGGPTYRLARALGVVRAEGADDGRLAVALVAVTWVPFVVVALLEWALTGHMPSPLGDYGIHARLLVALPLFAVAEGSLRMRTRRCLSQFVRGRWAQDGEGPVARLTAIATRRRDAVTPELLFVALAVIGSQAVLWRLTEPLGVVRGTPLSTAGHWSPSVIWYGFVALPVYQFLFYRWMWRWSIWGRLLWRLSRLRLRPMATHPDLQGGLAFLSEPSVGFGWVLLAINAVQAAVWADRITFAHVSLGAFKAQLALGLGFSLLLAMGPLLAFTHTLWRTRFDALRDYGRLATDHARLFQTRWIDDTEQRDSPDLLGAPAISSLADLGTAYEVIRRMRPVPFGARAIIVVAATVLVPMIPVVLMEIPLMTLLRRCGAIALGGLPG